MIKLLEKISSGRWVLTVMSGLCLCLLTFALVRQGDAAPVSAEAIVAIISTVFTSYFHKGRPNGDGT